VAECRFTQQAEADLMGIASYTLERWGEVQAVRCIDRLEACCERLANHPSLGRPCDRVRPGLRCMEKGSHVVFYRKEAGGILVSRVLHKSMPPEAHGFNDDEAENDR
jgi:toxin ParE1/3/4